MIDRWGTFVARQALAVLLAGIALAVFAGAYGAGVFDSLSQGGFEDPQSQSARELAAEQDAFGNRSVDVVAIYSDDTLTADSPEFRARVQQVLAGLPEGTTAQVVPWYAADDPAMVSRDGHSAQVLISMAGTGQDQLLNNYDRLEPALEALRAASGEPAATARTDGSMRFISLVRTSPGPASMKVVAPASASERK